MSLHHHSTIYCAIFDAHLNCQSAVAKLASSITAGKFVSGSGLLGGRASPPYFGGTSQAWAPYY